MADISMCLDHACPSKEQCYRYTAPVNECRQSYSGFSHEDKDKCESFVDNAEYQNRRTKQRRVS